MARKPLIPRTESVRQYREFVLANGRTPLQTADDPHERMLGIFATKFRQTDPSRLSPEDARARGDLIMLHNRHTTRRHNRRAIPDAPGKDYAEQVADFFDAYGQLPKRNNPDDSSSYRALKRLRSCASMPESAPLFEALADIPGLVAKRGLNLEAKLDAICQWRSDHGRLPSQRSNDPIERRLGFAWGRVRKNYELLSPGLREKADSLAQAYRRQARGGRSGFAPLPDGLYEAMNLAEFYASHGRLPRFGVEGEERDYNRLRQLRNRKLKGTITQEAQQAAEAVPGIFDFVRKDPGVQLERLKAWCAEHRRLPRTDAPEAERTPEALEEQELGRWMYRHVHRRHDPVETAATQATRDAILELREQYPKKSHYLRALKARAVLDFMAASGRLPELSQEPGLYRDCFTIRQKWDLGAAPLKVINEMIAATQGLPDHRHSQWDGNLRELERFFAEYGRPPRAGSRPPIPLGERQLARWLETAREIGDPARVAKLDAILGSVTRQDQSHAA